LALAVATASFTGSALAGGGNSANAPGQQKQAQTPAQPAAQATPPSQAKTPPGQAKKASSGSSSAGVKPSAQTAHSANKPSHTTVGAKPDVSKRYGNGNTAAQIAKSRGAPDSQPLTGPGNSQPHKTYDCRHKNNNSGGVDVHAIKSYSTSGCTQTQTQVQSTQVASVCGQTIITSTKVVPAAATHGNGKHAGFGHGNAVGHAKHTVTTVSTQVVANGQTCAPQQQQQVSAAAAVNQQAPAQQQAPAAQQQAAAPASQGGVLGAQASLAKPKSHHSVLGTIAGTSLPFTGFPLWIAVLIAAALILLGLALRRRAHPARL
jgi:hypothetical protein